MSRKIRTHGILLKAHSAPPRNNRLRTSLIVAGTGALCGLLFFAARARFHFLGDGYQSISLLAADTPAVKWTAPLLELLLPQLRPLFGENPESASLRAYQFVSIASGILFAASCAWFSRLLLSNNVDRLLFTLSCLTGGFALLFFGYVENYAPFAAFTAITFLTGLSVLEGKLRRIALIPPALLMASSHLFGMLALPAVAFVLLSSGSARNWIRWHRAISWSAAGAIAIVGAFALVRWMHADPQIEVAFLPMSSTWYVNEGYTLFSRHHLVDLANLFFLLFPGGAMCAAFAWFARPRPSLATSELIFFLLFAGALWTGVFVLSPELGMPRDWDLFAFAGVPIVFFVSLWILRMQSFEARLALAASIILGAVVLAPRVAEARVAPVGILQFRSYLALDPAKGRNGYFHLIRHYRRIGQDDRAQQELDEWEARYPERDLTRTAGELHRSGKTAEAIRKCRQVLAMNPVNYEAYMVLGEALFAQGEYEQARIASTRAYALSADRLRCTYNLGLANAALHNFPEAEKWLRKSIALAPDSFWVNLNYALVCQNLGRTEQHKEYLDRAAQCEGANTEIIEEARRVPPGKARDGA